jgi:uncharacterized protein YuzE
MNQRYLEVTFRDGKPIAAYLYLPRMTSDASVRTERHEGGLILDFTEDGRAIGIEITAPSVVSLDALNHALAAIHQEPASSSELAPLAAA